MTLPAMTFGEFIKQHRERMGYTIAELSEKGGFHSASLSAWENGVNRPTTSNFIKLSKALELPIDDLRSFDLNPVEAMKPKPINMVIRKINQARNSAHQLMTGSSQFEINMKSKLLDALDRCEEIMLGVQFLDEAF